MEEVIKIVQRARGLLVIDHCFWGILAMRLKLVSGGIPPWLPQTMATEGTTIYITPKFVLGLNKDECKGVLAHEVMHCAMGDIWRCGDRDQRIWNTACDYVNNLILVESGFVLPKGGLLDVAYKNMSKEEVYNILLKKALQKPSKGEGDGSAGGRGDNQDPCGGFYKPPNTNEQQQKEQEIEWKTATAQAATVSQGRLPSNLRTMIDEEVLDPPLPWPALLREFLQRTARNDYNWTRPNRRYLSRGIILPSLLSDELPLVVIGNDTSGSCLSVQPHFAKEISGILSSFQTTTLVVNCDAKVHEPVKEYKTEDLPIKLETKGGGGTSFVPVFDYIEEKGITPACLIYLTDLYGTFPKEPPEYPVMWVCINKTIAPFGETVYMQRKS